MPHAIRIHQTGGPEVLSWEEVDVPAPAAGEATVRQQSTAIYRKAGLDGRHDLAAFFLEDLLAPRSTRAS